MARFTTRAHTHPHTPTHQHIPALDAHAHAQQDLSFQPSQQTAQHFVGQTIEKLARPLHLLLLLLLLADILDTLRQSCARARVF